MRPRVAHIISSTGFYGAERVVVLLAKAQMAGGLAYPVVISLEDGRDSFQEVGLRAQREGLQAEFVRVSNRHLFGSAKSLATTLKCCGIDIAHAHGYKGLILGQMACRKMGIPITATNHGWDAPSWQVRIYEWLQSRVMRKLSKVVAVSMPIAREMENRGISSDRIEVIHNGVAVPETRQHSAEGRSGSGGTRSGKIIGYVGRLISCKGIDLLFHALARAGSTVGDSSVLIAGEGPEKETLVRLAMLLGLEKRIEWLGFCRDVEAVYRECDVIAIPSRYEGTPMVLLEAMSHGKAVVAADVGGIGDVISDGENGILVPPEDVQRLAAALVKVLTQDGLLDRLGASALETIRKRFSSEAMTSRYSQVYEQVLLAHARAKRPARPRAMRNCNSASNQSRKR